MGTPNRRKTRRSGTLVFLTALFFFGMGAVVLWTGTFKVPDLGSFEQRKVTESTKIYDRTGEVLLYDVFSNVKRTVVPIEEISRHIRNATVAIEDSEFYEHRGIKPTAIIRAIIVNIGTLGFSQGGSTITQQVVKNSILTTEKRISRKLKEWVLALKLERMMPKEKILELYLNEAPYGGSIYGVEEAAQAFFGKSSRDVSLAEAAYLAALPQAPSYYSPYGQNTKALEERKNLVLERMLGDKFIGEEEYEDALSERADFEPRSDTGIKAPHFVQFVREYLEEKYGKDVVESGGLRVTTSLDYGLQEKAQETAERFARENKEKFNAENAGFVAIDPKTGQILVMVGSRNYFDEEIDGQYNLATARRQPGSAFKPFVYATAFKKGYAPETVVFDLKTQFSTSCAPSDFSGEAPCYSPDNYDNLFRGPVSLRNALAQSINIPAVKTLYLAGLSDSLKTAKDMGITTLAGPGRYGLTLVLGGGEVSLLDMTSAYGVFAAGGVRNEYRAILKIEGKDGDILEEFSPRPERVLDENVAAQISDILSDEEARSPAFGERSYLYFPGRDVAAKTGTTNDYRDAWIIGYTPNISVGAWAGNNDNSSMEKKVAGFIVAPMWHEFMNTALSSLPAEEFRPPIAADKYTLKPVLRGEWKSSRGYILDSVSGKLATDLTPEETKKEILSTEVHSILYWVDKDDPNGPVPRNPANDPQFGAWEYPVRAWAARGGITDKAAPEAPAGSDDVHTKESKPTVFINGLGGGPYNIFDKLVFSVSVQGEYPVSKVEAYAGDKLIGGGAKVPYSFSFVPADITSETGNIVIRVFAYDSIKNKGVMEKTIFVR